MLNKLKSKTKDKVLYKVSKDKLKIEFNKIFEKYDNYVVPYKYRRNEVNNE